MAPPSHPLGGTDAEGEGRESCEAEGDVEKVQHGRAPWVAALDIAVGQRKGSIRESAGTRKERVKGKPLLKLTDLFDCYDAERRLPTIVPGDLLGGRAATQRLLCSRHKRIGIINGQPPQFQKRSWVLASRQAV